jgi:hypothetical protein
MSYNMMIGYDMYDCFTMEHFRLRQRMTLTIKIYCSRLYAKSKSVLSVFSTQFSVSGVVIVFVVAFFPFHFRLFYISVDHEPEWGEF